MPPSSWSDWPWRTPGSETRRKVWSKEDLPSVEEDHVREHTNKLGVHKFVGPEGSTRKC